VELLREMADFRARAEKVKNELEIFYYARK